MASTDAVPRVVRHVSAIFLVTPRGDVWRIFDSDDPSGHPRYSPPGDPRALSRIFVGSGATPVMRLYVFHDEESRTLSAELLMTQLNRGEPIAS